MFPCYASHRDRVFDNTKARQQFNRINRFISFEQGTDLVTKKKLLRDQLPHVSIIWPCRATVNSCCLDVHRAQSERDCQFQEATAGLSCPHTQKQYHRPPISRCDSSSLFQALKCQALAPPGESFMIFIRKQPRLLLRTKRLSFSQREMC